MTIRDFGVSYEELEPFFDQFERVHGYLEAKPAT